jgi:hypothetical protein
MDILHITQDDYGYWMLSLEKEDGTLNLLAHQFATPDKVIEMANELVREHKVIATIMIDPPRPGPETTAASAAEEYKKPKPRKTGA